MKGRDGALPELVPRPGLLLVLVGALAFAFVCSALFVAASSLRGPSRGIWSASENERESRRDAGTSVSFRRKNRVTVRLFDCWNAPSLECPSASGEDSAVLAAKTRPFTLSMSTNENLASTLSSRSFIFRPMALALGSACAWHARVNASPTSRALSVWLTRTTSASGRSSTCGEWAGPASGEGTPSPRKATAPHSSSTIRYWGGALARFALTLALRGMEAGLRKVRRRVALRVGE